MTTERSLSPTPSTDSGVELEYDVLGEYLPTFAQHLKDTQARLGLRVDSQDSGDQISVECKVEEDAEPHALSNWTSAEGDAFFRAVSVHSRWRPDLIAACVPTKTEWEVCMYLEALEEGAAALAVQADDEDVDMEDQDAEMQVNGSVPDSHDSRSLSDSDMDEDEDEDEEDEELCEPALEVSQDWIDAEEQMAAWIIDREHLVSLEEDAVADALEEVAKPPRQRRSGKLRGRPRRKTTEVVSGKDFPSLVHHSPPPISRPTLRRRWRDPARKREALMGRLGAPHLLVLDSILREGEEAMRDRSKSREGSTETRARDASVSSLSDRITTPSETCNVPESPSNVVIAPTLLISSGDVDSAGRQSGQAPIPTQGSSQVTSSSQPGAGNFMSTQDNATTELDPSANAETDLSSLSPRSRRRVQKRLYMRRKRALLRGESLTEVALDIGTTKLKPGKKGKSERGETPVVPLPVRLSETPSDGGSELPENAPKTNKPGLTLPYKLKAQFVQLGVDAAYLRDQGMHLLNLGALGRLMGLYSSLELGEEADWSAIGESIDAELIQYMQAGMVSFVTEVMHRVIVWREREIRLKQRSRVWRQGDQLTIGAVEHAVAAIGVRYHSHKAYLKSLEARHGLSTEATAAEPNSRDASDDFDVGVADLSAGLPRLSTHRDMYTPHICPPSGWNLSALGCLTRTYEREAMRTRRGTSEEIDEDELMSMETDEDALSEELAEEDEVEEMDMAASAKHEEELWGEIKE